MLYIKVVHDHESDDEIWGIDSYFDNTYDNWWMDTELARRVVEDVDKSMVVNNGVIYSPYLGYIPPKELSGGVKLILCLAFDKSNWRFNITRGGDNCMRWIQRLSEAKDLHVYMSNLPVFYDDTYFDILIENIGKHCKCYRDVLEAWAEVGH